MMRRAWHSWIQGGIAVSAVLFSSRVAVAQVITVQQPAVRSFGTATTVSVPDRGSMHLGGMGAASSGRTTPGPFRPGTSSGLERSASSMSASVYIHDLRAMDEALLAQGTHLSNESDPWSARLNERRAAYSRGVVSIPAEDTKAKAARYEQLARDAEANRKSSVARLHWQMAAKLGSSLAQQRLAEWKP